MRIILRIFERLDRGEVYREKIKWGRRLEALTFRNSRCEISCKIRDGFNAWTIPRGGKIEIAAED